LLSEGIDLKYGARHLKRAIERFLVYPLSNLVATEQVETGDLVTIDYDGDKLTFAKQSGKMIVNESDDFLFEEEPESVSDAVGLPLPQAQAAASGKGNKSNDNQES
jgi:hypothetical protein